MKVEWLISFRNTKTGNETYLKPLKNTIVAGGYENLALLLAGQEPSETAAMFLVIGSNSAPASPNDTIATMSETFRKMITTKTAFQSMARFRTFFLTPEANGDHQCFGLAARGTEQRESGILLNRLVVPFSKTDNMAMTIEVKWGFSE